MPALVLLAGLVELAILATLVGIRMVNGAYEREMRAGRDRMKLRLMRELANTGEPVTLQKLVSTPDFATADFDEARAAINELYNEGMANAKWEVTK